MKKFQILGLIAGLLFCAQVNAEPITLCLTGKVELTLPCYKTAFMNAVNLGLSQNPASKNVGIKTYFYDNKPMSALRAYNEMLQDQCSAIIGFEYLSDLLLVANSQKDTHIPIFTSYASSGDSDVYPRNIFIFSPSYDYQAKKMLAFLNKKFGKIKNALIITEINRADLAKYKIAYKNLLDSRKITNYAFDFLGNDAQFEKKLKYFVKDKKYQFVFVFSGAVGSTKILNDMNDHKTIFIGTENFGSSSNQSLYVRLNDKNIRAYTIRNIDLLKTTPTFDKFIIDYQKKYSIKPTPLSAYTYDAVSIILKALNEKHIVNTDTIYKTAYHGITGAYLENNKFHRSDQYVILSIDEKGFVYEE